MKVIHDNIWGDIVISDAAVRWIDTEEFQRLHSIRQTGVAYRVFPSATTTRFAHSIGTYHTTRVLIENIRAKQGYKVSENTDEELEWMCLAGLLHDIGHGPFSHTFDKFLEREGFTGRWRHHENRSIDTIASMDRRYRLGLGEAGLAFVASLIDPEGHPCDATANRWFSFIINNPNHGIDMDKLDYIARDNHQFGLSMTIDARRLLMNCRVIDDTLCFCNKVQDELWNLFMIRHRLHSTFYRHPRILRFEEEVIAMISGMADDTFWEMMRSTDVASFVVWTDSHVTLMADPVRKKEFDNRTSPIVAITPPGFMDNQFSKLEMLSFYDRKEPDKKIRVPFPSPFCPFSIPS